jgi:NitT/TauT family transport system substrate-binding protein
MNTLSMAGVIRNLAVALALLCVTAAQAQDKVSVRMKWFHQAQFAGFYIASEKGYYKEANLDVALNPGGPDFPAVQMVAGGSEDFGVTSADQILIARGRDVPVVALAVLYRKSPFVLFSLKSSNIERAEQFAGKRIGVKLGGNEELVYRAVLKKAGLDGKNMNETAVKFDMTPLLTGQLDVWPGYVINEVLSAKEKGFDVNIIWPDSYGINLYADTLFATEKLLREKPDVVKRFVAATLKGWDYAVKNPEEAAKATLKYGNKLSYEHELAMMKASIPLLLPDKRPIGTMDAAEWKRLNDVLAEGGFLKRAVELDKAYSASYLAK